MSAISKKNSAYYVADLMHNLAFQFTNFVDRPKLLHVRVKIFVLNKKRDIEWRYTTYVNPTPMSLLMNLASSSDGKDIGVVLT